MTVKVISQSLRQEDEIFPFSVTVTYICAKVVDAAASAARLYCCGDRHVCANNLPKVVICTAIEHTLCICIAVANPQGGVGAIAPRKRTRKLTLNVSLNTSADRKLSNSVRAVRLLCRMAISKVLSL